jgi:hypothetical protein
MEQQEGILLPIRGIVYVGADLMVISEAFGTNGQEGEVG